MQFSIKYINILGIKFLINEKWFKTMRFALLKEQKVFFQKHGFVEFESILSDQQVDKLLEALEIVLAERLKKTSKGFAKCSIEEAFLRGRDTWRDNDFVKKNIFKSSLANLASELMGEGSLRLAYDQFLMSGKRAGLEKPQIPSFSHLVGEETFTLNEVSGFQGKLCGLLLCLCDSSCEESSNRDEKFLPSTKGSGVYFCGEIPLSYRFLLHGVNQRYLLIVYSENRTQYVLREADPHTYALKRYGYTYGDVLREKYHPLVCR